MKSANKIRLTKKGTTISTTINNNLNRQAINSIDQINNNCQFVGKKFFIH